MKPAVVDWRPQPAAIVVLAGHALVLWGLLSGMHSRVAEVVEPMVLQVRLVAPPTPRQAPAPSPAAPSPANPQPQLSAPPMPTPVLPNVRSEPVLPLAADAPPAPAQPVAAAPSGQAAPATSVATAPAPPPDVAPKIELPSTDAAYGQNPPPVYPAASKRQGEQGRVLVRVLIGADGRAQRAEIKQSSGFERLDQAALQTVQSWRYLPGRRGGVAEAMWFVVPINFVLE
jgi:protein TonB